MYASDFDCRNRLWRNYNYLLGGPRTDDIYLYKPNSHCPEGHSEGWQRYPTSQLASLVEYQNNNRKQ